MTGKTEAAESVEHTLEKVNAEQIEELHKETSIETLHNDEAVKVLAAYEGDLLWTEEEEKSLVKKIDRRLLSIIVTTYGMQYYDKAMLGQAVGPSEICCRANSTDMFYPVGTLRPRRRSGVAVRTSLLFQLGDLLPWLHHRSISSDCNGATIPDRTGHVHYRVSLGSHIDVHCRCDYLPRSVCAAVLSRNDGKWRESPVDACCWRVSRSSLSYSSISNSPA